MGEKDKFEVTLLLNLLLGLIVVPSEKGLLNYLPNKRIEELGNWGLARSQIFIRDIKGLKDLMIQLRHAIAHFDISFEADSNNSIQAIIFSNTEKHQGEFAKFDSASLKGVVENIAKYLLNQYEIHKDKAH